MRQLLNIAPEVADAIRDHRPVVALESTVIAHGLPRPQNLQTAHRLQEVVREGGAVPATIAIIGGKLTVGLADEEIRLLAEKTDIRKISTRDIPLAVAQDWDGATTVASTSWIAHRAGIKVFATGGIGGVHRGALPDVSADLPELARTPIAVVCSGAKIVLDLPATREWLETHAVTVVGYKCNELPAFYTRGSGLPVDACAGDPAAVANIFRAQRDLGIESALLVVVPVPAEFEVPAEELQQVLTTALEDAEWKEITGPALTPFLLSQMAERSGGATLRANIALLENNARVAAQIATVLAPTVAPSVLNRVTLRLPQKQSKIQEDPMADDKNKCKNPSCTCPAQPGGKYCSASCEGSGDTIELDCDCGHDECGGNF